MSRKIELETKDLYIRMDTARTNILELPLEPHLYKKWQALISRLQSSGGAVVAFSEGVVVRAWRWQRTFKQIGFRYATLDLESFRSGSLNEVLKQPISVSPADKMLGSDLSLNSSNPG